MDAVFVLTSCNWIMAELVRVFHSVSVAEAQDIVDKLVERRMPLLWVGDDVRRILDPSFGLREQILLLLCTSPGKTATSDLKKWTGYKNNTYFKKLLLEMHELRLIELADDGSFALILPPGRDSLRSDRKAQHRLKPCAKRQNLLRDFTTKSATKAAHQRANSSIFSMLLGCLFGSHPTVPAH